MSPIIEKEIDELYEICNVNNEDEEVNFEMNYGTLNNRLNTNHVSAFQFAEFNVSCSTNESV